MLFSRSPHARRHTLLALVFTLCAAAATFAQTGAAQAGETVRVTLLQVNDVYQISPVDKGKRGGLARLATLRKIVLEESPHTLYLLAGDTLGPSVASNIFKGRQMIAAWNATGLDYAALGNHEFDFGDAILRERMRESKFTWLGSNVFDRKTGKLFGDMPPFVVREFGGVKVGLFGLLTVDTKQTSSPGADVEFRDPCLTAQEMTKQLRSRGAR